MNNVEDLDGALRAMLADRARDVDTLPDRFTDLAALDRGARPRRLPRTWLVAAAIVAVLTVAAVAIALGRGDSRRTPPSNSTSPQPTPTHATATPTPPSPHAARTVALTRIVLGRLPGYTVQEAISEPGRRLLKVHRDGDQGAPPGCNGCGTPPPSAMIVAYDRERFRLSSDGTGWSPVRVAGHDGRVGTTLWAGRYRVPSVAWQIKPGRWVVVQGLTAATQGTSELQRIAASVRGEQEVGLPFRLGWVPGPPVTAFDDSRPQYALTMMFGRIGSREVDITLWPGRGTAGKYDATGAARVTISGRPGWLSYTNGAAVQLRDALVIIGIGEGDSPLTSDDKAALRRILDNISFSGGDGSGPLIPADRAIP